MKQLMVIKTILTALCLSALVSTVSAQNDADPAITSCSFAVSPVLVDNTTTLTVAFSNQGFGSSIATNSVGLQISLPTSAEYVAFPQSIAAISGTFASKFTWSYNSAAKSFMGTSNQAILAGTGGTIIVNVKGLTPTLTGPLNSVATIIRLTPSAYPNENINNNNLTAALGVAVGGPLPVSILSFTATKHTSTVALNWKTSFEFNSSHFDLETSTDAVNWKYFGEVAAAGNSSKDLSYDFIHTNPLNGTNYYRFKQVDLDGRYVYSDIRKVNFSSKSDIKIMPNPTVDRVIITANRNVQFESVSILSADGRVMQQQRNFQSGKSMDMSNYATGTYLIRIVDENGQTEIKTVLKN